MSEAIRINSLKERSGRFRLEISTLEEPLVISVAIVHRHRLKEGVVITPAQMEQLLAEIQQEECDREVARLLGLREHSVGEIRFKLQRKRFPKDLINSTIKDYLNRGLLDDARYAHYMARHTLDRRPSGRSYLMSVLQRHGIERVLAEQVVDDLLLTRDEIAMATAALQQRWSRFSEFDIETARKKAYNYLSRRGFGYAAARAAYEALSERAGEVTED